MFRMHRAVHAWMYPRRYQRAQAAGVRVGMFDTIRANGAGNIARDGNAEKLSKTVEGAEAGADVKQRAALEEEARAATQKGTLGQ